MVNRTSGIEPRHLLALTELRDQASFKGAAQRLGYTQAAISQQIAQLEQVTGASVVERRRGLSSAALTGVGSLLASHADGVLDQLAAAAADLRALAHPAPVLRVGVPTAVAAGLVPRTIAELARAAPAVRLVVSERRAGADAAAVRAGDLDGAVTDLPLPPGPFEMRELLSTPLVLVTGRESRWTLPGGPPDVDDLAALPLLAPDGPIRTLVEARLAAAGREPHWILPGALDAGLQALARAGIGAAIVPRTAVNAGDPGITATDLSALFAPRRLALYWHADRRRIDGIGLLCDAIQRAERSSAPPVASPAVDDVLAVA